MYIILLIPVGHSIAAGVLGIIVLQAMGGYRWLTKIGVAIGMGLGSYLLFDILFKVHLPKGILFG